jgi:hypothetical protein
LPEFLENALFLLIPSALFWGLGRISRSLKQYRGLIFYGQTYVSAVVGTYYVVTAGLGGERRLGVAVLSHAV